MKPGEAVFQSRRVAARLTTQETASLLGFMASDIPILIREKYLKPLGNPTANAMKYFAAIEVLALAEDVSWLSRATRCVYEYHRRRNATEVIVPSP